MVAAGGHHSGRFGVSAAPSLPGAAHLPRCSSASASPERSPTPVQRVSSGAAVPLPLPSPRHAAVGSPRSGHSVAAWAHDSGPEVLHYDHLRGTADTDATTIATADFVDTDSSRAAAGETLRSTVCTGSRSSSPAPGDPPRGAASVGVFNTHAPAMHSHVPTAEYWGMVSDPGRPAPMAYMTAFPSREGSSAGSSAQVLPGEAMPQGHSGVGAVSGSPLGGPAVGNPALRGEPAAAAAADREPSQDSLLNSNSGGSIGHEGAEEGAAPALQPVGGVPLGQLVAEASAVSATAGGGPSIASTVSPLDMTAAGGGPSIASTITPAPSRDGASASHAADADSHFSLPVIGAAAWAGPALGGGGSAFPAMSDPEVLLPPRSWPQKRERGGQ